MQQLPTGYHIVGANMKVALLPGLLFRVATVDVPRGEMRAVSKAGDAYKRARIPALHFCTAESAFVLTDPAFPFVLSLNATSKRSTKRFVTFCEGYLEQYARLTQDVRPVDLQLTCFGHVHAKFLAARLVTLSRIHSLRIVQAEQSDELLYFAKYPEYAWNGTTFKQTPRQRTDTDGNVASSSRNNARTNMASRFSSNRVGIFCETESELPTLGLFSSA